MSDVTDRTLVLRDALGGATRRLTDVGLASPRADAEQLAAHVLGVSRGSLATVDALEPAQAEQYDALVSRRAERVPLQHLTGVAGFRHLDIAVGPGVFVPRPESEVVAGFAIDWLRGRRLDAPVVVELCAGSAAIALSMAHEVPGAVVHAVELDAGAVSWARRNAVARTEAGDPPVTVHHGDVADALPELAGRVDCLVANPPYVAEAELADVDPEVRDHDPRVALVAGEDGLAVIRAVVARAATLLRPGGLLVVEHSDRQGESAPEVVRAASGWVDVADHHDLTGRPRFLTAVRSAP